MQFSRRSFLTNAVDYFEVPLVAAKICHFWALDLVYSISKRVTRLKADTGESLTQLRVRQYKGLGRCLKCSQAYDITVHDAKSLTIEIVSFHISPLVPNLHSVTSFWTLVSTQ